MVAHNHPMPSSGVSADNNNVQQKKIFFLNENVMERLERWLAGKPQWLSTLAALGEDPGSQHVHVSSSQSNSS